MTSNWERRLNKMENEKGDYKMLYDYSERKNYLIKKVNDYLDKNPLPQEVRSNRQDYAINALTCFLEEEGDINPYNFLSSGITYDDVDRYYILRYIYNLLSR
jgi:hypothetical protein